MQKSRITSTILATVAALSITATAQAQAEDEQMQQLKQLAEGRGPGGERLIEIAHEYAAKCDLVGQELHAIVFASTTDTYHFIHDAIREEDSEKRAELISMMNCPPSG